MLLNNASQVSTKFVTLREHLHAKTKRSIIEPGLHLEFRKNKLLKSHAATVTQDPNEIHSNGGILNFHGLHHVGLICANLENSLRFYCDILGLSVNPDRPHKKLPYRGAWLWIGAEMIHLMELPNPDPLTGRPDHGGRDRHICVGIEALDPLVNKLETNEIEFTASKSGRRAVFFRDPDMNCVEVFECKTWHK